MKMVNRGREAVVSLFGLEDDVDSSFISSTRELATHDVPLAPIGGRSFDGASRVDVVVRYRPGMAVAVELKLGTTRLSRTRIDEEWLAPCGPSHQVGAGRGT